MALGYEVYEDNRNFEQDGLTGDVKRYVTEKMEFPCYIIVATPDNIVENYKISVLTRMFANIKTYNEDDANSSISLYFNQGDKTVKLGKIFPKQVKSFLKLFEGNIVDGFYDKDTKLTDDYLYVLSN